MQTETRTEGPRDPIVELGFDVVHALDQENTSGVVLRRRHIEARAIRAQSIAALVPRFSVHMDGGPPTRQARSA